MIFTTHYKHCIDVVLSLAVSYQASPSTQPTWWVLSSHSTSTDRHCDSYGEGRSMHGRFYPDTSMIVDRSRSASTTFGRQSACTLRRHEIGLIPRPPVGNKHRHPFDRWLDRNIGSAVASQGGWDGPCEKSHCGLLAEADRHERRELSIFT